MVLGFYGASGLGQEYYELARIINDEEKRWDEFVFIDDDPEKQGQKLSGLDIVSFEKAKEKYGISQMEFVLSIGEPFVKDIVFTKLQKENCTFTNLIHSTVHIPAEYTIGVGVVVNNYSSIPPMSVIGNNVLIQGTATMGHGVVLGDNVVISSFAFVGGGTTIGKDAYIAPHACLRNGIHIGSGAVIGMGSVVTKDIPDNAVAYGNPCKVVRINEKGRVFSK